MNDQVKKVDYIAVYQSKIERVISESQSSNSVKADIKNALKEKTEYKAYSHLVRWGIDIENDVEREAAIVVLSAVISGSANVSVGGLTFPEALSLAMGPQSSDLRFQRLIASTDAQDFIKSVSKLVGFVQARLLNQPINYAQLWSDMLSFNYRSDKIKLKWASQFYRSQESVNGEKASSSQKGETNA